MKSFSHLNPFQKARLKLTGWYILIILLLLATFSLLAIRAEQRAFDRIEQALADREKRPVLTSLLEKRLAEFEGNFQQRLITFDLILLVTASGAAYFLSGRTLRPIAEMIKKQEEFSADASHELRTPLTTISMEIEAIKRTEKKLPAKYQNFFDSIQEEISRMRNIVDGLLILVRSNSLNQQKNWQVFDFDKLIKETFEQMNLLAKGKKIDFKLLVKENLTVFGNQEQLKQVVIILIDNAVKYTPPAGKVTAELLRQGKTALFSVIDTGIGISEKDLPHIFERFYRGQGNTGEKGVGLGLSIAQKIVESHQGKISVESKLGHGSKFTVSLPVRSQF